MNWTDMFCIMAALRNLDYLIIVFISLQKFSSKSYLLPYEYHKKSEHGILNNEVSQQICKACDAQLFSNII